MLAFFDQRLKRIVSKGLRPPPFLTFKGTVGPWLRTGDVPLPVPSLLLALAMVAVGAPLDAFFPGLVVLTADHDVTLARFR